MGKGQKEEGCCVDLKVTPFIVPNDCCPSCRVVLCVERVLQGLSVLEELDLVGLAHHRKEESSHTLHSRVLELKSAPLIIVETTVGKSKAPDGVDRVYVISVANERLLVY